MTEASGAAEKIKMQSTGATVDVTLSLPLNSRAPHVFTTLSLPLDSTTSSRLSVASFPRGSSRTSPPHCSCTGPLRPATSSRRRPTSTASGCSSSSSSWAGHPSRTSSSWTSPARSVPSAQRRGAAMASWVRAVRVEERSGNCVLVQ
jgi:hypothetical protein